MTVDPIISRSERVEGADATPLRPFGLLLCYPPGTRLETLDPDALVALTERHRVLVLRGVQGVERHELALMARRLGPLLPWSFGAINELVVKPETDNYLYTPRAVPLHWDGAFLGTPPRLLFFHCVKAPEQGGGTTFVDTTRIWAKATPAQRAHWRFLSFRYRTEKKVHYGGTFEARLVQHHPRTGEVVLRFAEPVDDLNPVELQAVGLDPAQAADALLELQSALNDPEQVLVHSWQDGDYVLADNFTLLHGRQAFPDAASSARHLRRVNVMLGERTRLDALWDSLRIRRPEFLVAEIPILLVPALLVAPAGELFTWSAAQVAAIVLLLFHFGDMVNCLADRELDLVYKTRTAEAVFGLGPSNVRWQIRATVTLTLWLTIDLAARTDRWWVVPWVLCGLLLGWQYSEPPLRLKSRGALQIWALCACIFIGPMVLVTSAWLDRPPVALVAFALAYAAMQQGIVLVNTAEDLREDRAFGLYTSAVSLGATGSLLTAGLLVLTGGLGVWAHLGEAPAVVMLPFLLGWGWALLAIGRLSLRARRSADPEAVIREGAKEMPAWITATAWGTLAAAAWLRWS